MPTKAQLDAVFQGVYTTQGDTAPNAEALGAVVGVSLADLAALGVMRWVGPYKIGTFDGQSIANPGAEGGTFTLSLGAEETSTLAFDCTAAQMQSALEALSNVGVGNVSVVMAGNFSNSDPTIIFASGIATELLTGNGGGLTGAEAPYTIAPVGAGSFTIPLLTLDAGEVLEDIFISPNTSFDPTGVLWFADNADGSASFGQWSTGSNTSLADFDLTNSVSYSNFNGSTSGDPATAMTVFAQGVAIGELNAGDPAYQKVPIIAKNEVTIYACLDSVGTDPTAGEVWIWAKVATPVAP